MALSQEAFDILNDLMDGRKAERKRFRCDELRIDNSYQREPKPENIRKLAENWNDIAAGVALIGRRADGSRYCVDGNTRRLARMRNGEAYIEGIEFDSPGPKAEAALYLVVNRNRRATTPRQNFKAALRSGDSRANGIKATAAAAGWEVLYSRKARNFGELECVSAVEKIWDAGGADLLTRTVKFLQECFPGNMNCRHEAVVGGVGQFLNLYEGTFNRPRLVKILKKAGPTTLMQECNSVQLLGGGGRPRKIAAGIVALYNKGLEGGPGTLPHIIERVEQVKAFRRAEKERENQNDQDRDRDGDQAA